MGHSVTPTFRVEFTEGRTFPQYIGFNCAAWQTKYAGRPTNENLAKYVEAYHESLKPGNTNWHLCKSASHIPYWNKARIIRQKTGEIVAEWNAPAFMVV